LTQNPLYGKQTDSYMKYLLLLLFRLVCLIIMFFITLTYSIFLIVWYFKLNPIAHKIQVKGYGNMYNYQLLSDIWFNVKDCYLTVLDGEYHESIPCLTDSYYYKGRQMEVEN